jgi:hypothetical protein
VYLSSFNFADLHHDQWSFAAASTPVTSPISASSPNEDKEEQLIFDMDVDDDDFLTVFTPGSCKYFVVILNV